MFKACRQMFRLRYIDGWVPATPAEPLEVGKKYHALLEELNNTGEFDADSLTKECAMAEAYKKYIYPHFKVVAAEKQYQYDLGDGDCLIGIVDGIAEDGHIVEHKTTGSEITEQYEYNLLWDEQILAYMLLTGSRKVWYTVCRKPTIRQKQDETDEEFFIRMVDWYSFGTETKIRLLEIERTDDEVEQFRKELDTIKATMQEAIEDGNFYKNTCHCNVWGRRCEYSGMCINYDPNAEYIEYVKDERRL
jgi:hypothetical protein